MKTNLKSFAGDYEIGIIPKESINILIEEMQPTTDFLGKKISFYCARLLFPMNICMVLSLFPVRSMSFRTDGSTKDGESNFI